MSNRVEIVNVNTSKLQLLTQEETKELFKKMNEGDKNAREKLINGNLRLVLSVIQRFCGRGEKTDDLFQVECVGLIKAIDNFDTSLDIQLSTFIPENFLKRLKINQENLKQELELLTDLYTEDLFTNKSCNIIKAELSRIVCDMERFRDDKKETMSRVGMGAIYTKTSNGDELIEYDDAYKSRILSEFYDVYHKKLENTTNKVLKECGRCVIIDCHSFSAELLRRLGMEHSDSPDICIGYEKEFADMDILNTLKMHFEKCGLSVNFNYPYTGSIVPNKYYAKKDSRVKSLMIEVNKLLYLDENNHKNANYQRIKDIIQEAIEKVIAMEKILDTIER